MNSKTGEPLAQLTPDELFPNTALTQVEKHSAYLENDTGRYLLTPGGIFFQQSGTESWQQLVDGSLAFIPTNYVSLFECAQARHREGYTAWYSGMYMPHTIVGVNAAGKLQEQSLELAALLFSLENQQLDWTNKIGLPVHKQALREQLTAFTVQAAKGEAVFYSPDMDSNYPIYNATEVDAEWYTAQLEAAGTPANFYINRLQERDAVLSALLELTPGYLQGKRSLNDTANELLNRISLIENE